MKTLLTLLLTLGIGLAHAQMADSVKLPVDPVTQRITYAEVVQAPGISQAELYTRAKLWFGSAFKSAKSVIQTDEKDAGLVQGEGWSPMEIHMLGKSFPAVTVQLWYTVKLACREGRYRYEITEFKQSAGPTTQKPIPSYTPIEQVIANWTKSPSKNGKPAKVYMAKTDIEQTVSGTSAGLATSIKAGLARKPGTASDGKDW